MYLSRVLAASFSYTRPLVLLLIFTFLFFLDLFFLQSHVSSCARRWRPFTNSVQQCLADMVDDGSCSYEYAANPATVLGGLLRHHPEFGGRQQQDALEVFQAILRVLAHERGRPPRGLQTSIASYFPQLHAAHDAGDDDGDDDNNAGASNRIANVRRGGQQKQQQSVVSSGLTCRSPRERNIGAAVAATQTAATQMAAWKTKKC